jgi:predicted transcriptional regulator
MRQLNVKLSAKQHERLRRFAARRRTPVAWLIKDYVDSLAERDEQLDVRAHEGTQIAARGRAFEWLAAEPDLYTESDGDPIRTARGRP